MSNLWQGYWECRRVEGTHTRDRGKRQKYVAPYLLQVSSRFFLSALRPNYITSTKFKWGQLAAWLIFGIFFPPDIGALFPTLPSHSVHDPQLTPELRANKRWLMNFRGCRLVDCEEWCLFCHQISSCTSPKPSSTYWKKRIQLSNACLRARNGGVGAEICLCKVKWDNLAGRGVSFSRGDLYYSCLLSVFLFCLFTLYFLGPHNFSSFLACF